MQDGTQATVKHFDPDTRSGSVVFDDGRELAFDAEAFDRGGLLKLRLGQRVRLALRSDPDPAHHTAPDAAQVTARPDTTDPDAAQVTPPPPSADPDAAQLTARLTASDPALDESAPVRVAALTIATMAFPPGVESSVLD